MTYESDIEHFLIVYDVTREQAEVLPFGHDYARAVARYEELEAEYEGLADLEVVLLSADSIDTIRRTHSSYFATARQAIEKMLPRGVLN